MSLEKVSIYDFTDSMEDQLIITLSDLRKATHDGTDRII